MALNKCLCLSTVPILACLAILGMGICFSPGISAPSADPPARKPTPLFVGMAECARCHREPNKDEPAPLLCRCNEVQIWETQDKHRIAHLVLRNERSVQMGKLLGIANPASDKRCIACHGVYLPDERLRHRSFLPERAIQEGVTCVVCHGAYKDWIDLHGGIDRETWRTFSRERKEQEYGMIDLWDPVRRAQLCVSCHVGDPAQGRLVTHAMYAAGHPPLSAFELVAYSDAMPRHWQYPSEKSAPVRALLQIAEEHVQYDKSRTALVGALVAFRQSQQLLIQATSTHANDPSVPTWPDFAYFNCYSCHRPLRQDFWKSGHRQLSPLPGRPGWRSWPVQILAMRSAFDTWTDPPHQTDPSLTLDKAFRSTLFGHPETIHAHALRNLAYCDQLLSEARTDKLNRAKIVTILLALSDPNSYFPYDFDSARHRVWLLKAIYDDLDLEPTKRQEIQAFFDILANELVLDLRKTGSDTAAASYLRLAEAAAHFEPQRLRSRLNALHAALKRLPRD
jgi:hypothetical protein